MMMLLDQTIGCHPTRAAAPVPRFSMTALAAVALAGLAAFAALTGCSTQATRFYTLAAPAVGAGAGSGGSGSGGGNSVDAGFAPSISRSQPARSGLRFDLAPIVMDERLARPQMVVREAAEAGARVDVLEQSRWTSSFEFELRDALAAGIARRSGAIDVTRSGAAPGQPVWRIGAQLTRFDAIEDSRVDMAFDWTLRRSGRDGATVCRWATSEPVANGIDALAQGAQRATARAADAIARQISALEADPQAGCLQGVAPPV